ncbi:MAG: metal-dependent hydrolase [Verrucomicrobiota bacterium]
MDPISQGALGAVAAASVAGREDVRKATLVGWVAGMLADADVFIRSEADPLLTIEYHRHFTHSLMFVPVGALVCAAFFWLVTRRWWKPSFGRLYLFSFLGYATAGLLDACTSYGTQLWWPFSDERVAWHIISIVDPLFTGMLLVLILGGLIRRRAVWMRAALVFVVCYLGFGVVQRERTEGLQVKLAAERGHEGIGRATVKPTIGNLVLWRSIYEYEGEYWVDGIRTGVLGEPVIYEGVRVPVLRVEDLQARVPEGSVLWDDLERFDHFSDGHLAWHPNHEGVLGDLRYGALPQSVKPLWGIRVDWDSVDERVPFEGFREFGEAERGEFGRMLRGEELTRSRGATEGE